MAGKNLILMSVGKYFILWPVKNPIFWPVNKYLIFWSVKNTLYSGQ